MAARKLPPREQLFAILRFGFDNESVADVFDTSAAAVSRYRAKFGLPRCRGGIKTSNGAKSANRYNPRWPQVMS